MSNSVDKHVTDKDKVYPPDAFSEKGATEPDMGEDTKPHRPPLKELDKLTKEQVPKAKSQLDEDTYQSADEITPG